MAADIPTQAPRDQALARLADQYPAEFADVVATWDPARYRALNRLAARHHAEFAGLLDEEHAADQTEQQEDPR